MGYGLENYEYRDVYEQTKLEPLPVEGGVPGSGRPYDEAYVKISMKEPEQELRVLLKEGEAVEKKIQLPKALTAPVESGSEVGSVKYYLDGDLIGEYSIVADQDVERMDFRWTIGYIWSLYAL